MLYTLYFLVTSHPILRIPILAAALLALMLALAACGGGDGPAPPMEPTEAPASTAQPASTRASGSTASTPAPASTSAPRSTESPASTGAATPSPTSAAPTSAPAEPTPVPAMVLPPGLLTARPCEEVFREMLANYDGVERFDAALVTDLSNEFVELRPDCAAQGWDPEFSDEPVVCEDWTDLRGAIHDGRAPGQVVAPTQWRVSESQGEELGITERIRINVHLARIPLSSDAPASMNPAGGDLIGGCWHYNGVHFENGQSRGRWTRSFFKYVLTSRGSANRSRPWVTGVTFPPQASPSATTCSRARFRLSSTPAPPSIRPLSPLWLPGSGRRRGGPAGHCGA